MNDDKPKRGRPTKAADEKKRARSLSLDDNEYNRLLLQTRKAGLGAQTSAYIIKTLKLAL